MDDKKLKVMSLRLDDRTYRRLHAYGVSKGLPDSAAARELIVSGLAQDGLGLYSTELGAYLRRVMQPLLDGLARELDGRDRGLEDRVARAVHRASRGSIVAAIAAIECERALYDGLADVDATDVYARYDAWAGRMQAGMTLGEARDRDSAE